MTTLEIRDLCASVIDNDVEINILKGVDLTVRSGEVHAVMGPNGSGTSTLASCIAGHPKYSVTQGSITLDGQDLLELPVHERARAGVFLAMQYPVEVPGVSSANFLRTAAAALRGEAPKLRHWIKEVNDVMELLEMDPAFGQRDLNVGWSGGEKKRHEILQLEVLKPKIALLDETDSGLDVDALRIVSDGINRSVRSGLGVLMITHYSRILRYVRPDVVHVFHGGRIVESGPASVADELEASGYARFSSTVPDAQPTVAPHA
jgi:Fe-S cluster assembly ATP-binding protein